MSRNPTITVAGKPIQYANRTQIAKILGVTADTVSGWVSAGVLPKPFDLTTISQGNKSKKRGRRAIFWNLYEVIETVNASRK